MGVVGAALRGFGKALKKAIPMVRCVESVE